jgi:hypothetical protein
MPDQDGFLAMATDVCDPCSAIEWAVIPPSHRKHVRTIHESVEESLASSCRICRIFGLSIPLPYTVIPPVEISMIYDAHRGGESGVVDFACQRKASLLNSSSYHFPWVKLHWGRSVTGGIDTLHHVEQTRLVHADLIKSWLGECTDGHDQCAPTQQTSLSSLRVIDCINECVIVAPTPCLYVALSYVWGKPSECEDLDTEFSVMNLPQTVKDSLEVTRMTGHQYLWVDRYVRMTL